MKEMEKMTGTEGVEVNMDEYMKIADYTLEENRAVVRQARECEYASFTEKLFNGSNLIEVKDIQKTENLANDAKNMAETANEKAILAQGTANEAKMTAEAASAGLLNKVDKTVGKQLSSNDYSNEEKAKLAGIQAGANNYMHPGTHPASMITGLPEVMQRTGESAKNVMSQKAVTDAIEARVSSADKGDVEPIGAYKFYAGEILPEGYLWCDGTSYPMNGDYRKLYEAIGTRYNQSGDEEETFRVPDMRGRVGVGKNTGTFNVLGKTGGEESHKLTVGEMAAHNHVFTGGNTTTSGAGDHNHVIKNANGKYTNFAEIGSGATNYMLQNQTGNNLAVGIVYGTTNAGLHTHTLTANGTVGNTGSSAAHNNLQPYLVCNYIIKYKRAYSEIGVTTPPCIWNIMAADWKARTGGGYELHIPAVKHGRGQQCVLTALFQDVGNGSLKQVVADMQKDSAGNITLITQAAFAGKAYIDSAGMQTAGRVVTVNGQKPDSVGNVNVFENPIVLGESNYGSVLPASLQKGQLFFLIEE